MTKLLLSDPPVTQKSLNLRKSVKNWSKIAKIAPWGPFWGSDQTFFFLQKDKSFAPKSKIKKLEFFSDAFSQISKILDMAYLRQ